MKRIVSLVLALSMVLSMFSFAFAGTAVPDVEGTEYEAAVSALVELGIVHGFEEDGTYRPGDTVTRAQMAKLLVFPNFLFDFIHILTWMHIYKFAAHCCRKRRKV